MLLGAFYHPYYIYSYFQAQYEFYEKFTLGILHNDINTVLKGNGHSENVSVIDKNEKEDIKQEDIDKQTREDEKVALSDEKILQYRIPRFNEAKIIGKFF